jgi:hypothetical protein
MCKLDQGIYNTSYTLIFIMKKKIFIVVTFLGLVFFSSTGLFSQTISTISTPTINIAPSASLCAGTNISFTYVTTGTFTAGNIFTIQLSNPGGSFATSPVTLATVAATQSTTATTTTRTGSYAVPLTSATSTLYRTRVISSTPAINGTDNGYGFTINAPTTALAITFTSVCQNENISVALTKTCTFPAGNVFTFQLSDPTGSFASPTTLATYTNVNAGTYTMTIPSGTAAGNNYQIQAVSSNTATPNSTTSTFTVYAAAGTPGTYGNGFWNAYCYNALNSTAINNFSTNYQGYYTENNLSFASTSRFISSASPSNADGSSGSAFAGCPFDAPGTNYTVRYLRTNLPCGYYQIDIPSHDDYAYVFINGVQTYSTPYNSGTAVSNVWNGFIGPSTLVEISYSNNGGPGNLTANVYTVNPLVMSTPVTVCAGTNANISVSTASTATAPATYSWTPSSTVSPTTGTSVTATPTATTVYTVSATDNYTLTNSGCAITNTINITVNPVPTTTIAATSTLDCSGVTSSTLTTGGANTYTWSPAAGLSSTSGTSVIANPTVTTTYTVSGSNNCSAVNASTLITVQTIPVSPTTTTYGNNVWNVYCYNGPSGAVTVPLGNNPNYFGYYTENNLSFVSSPTRWNATYGPFTCTTTATGLAYSGCTPSPNPGTYWGLSFKRTGIPCGYYQIDLPSHDDNFYLYINNTATATANSSYSATCCSAATNIWSGFIGPSTTIELQLVNNTGPGNISINFTPITYPILSPPATICAGTTTTLTANYIAGANYSWLDGSGGSTLSTTTGTTTVGTPTVSTSYSCTVTDPVTTCSASAHVAITVNPLPNTSVTPTTSTISCAINTFTLTASGANTYTWSPAAGLSSSTGLSVIASPTVTTNYTVTGSNNCATSTATTNISVVVLVTPTVVPSGQWNAYCYGDNTFTNYYGYYTELGTGASTFDFNTTTRWAAATAVPSNANSTNGQAYKGCTMPSSTWGISFKRTGFPCGTYSVNMAVTNTYSLFINGSLAAQRTASGSTLGAWTGALCATSQVEIRYVQSSGTTSLTATFIPVNTSTTTTQTTWMGGTSNDWFTAANWCGGNGGVPTYTNDVVVTAAGTQNMPIITAAGAQCRSMTISAATASTTPTSTTLTAIPSASLTTSASYNLDVFGNWYNRGVFTPNTGSITFNGSTAATVSSTATEAFYNLTINNSGGITMSSGINQVSNIMTFSTGIVTQSAITAPYFLQLLNGSSVTGANNASYVDGYMVKYGNSAFTFPLGTGNIYRPIAISAPANVTDNFSSRYFYANPYTSYPTTTWDNGINHLSGCEYWILNRTGGVSNVNVTLSWNTNSCGVTDSSALIVTRWDAGLNAWKNHGNGGITGNTTAGTVISSAPITSFSPFTLGSSTANNPLPIGLVNFNCNLISKDNVELKWITATEINNKYFSIERSADGASYQSVGIVQGAGNSTALLNYKFNDYKPLEGVSYYMLKQVDFNGNSKTFDACVMNVDANVDIVIYPNPSNNMVTIDLGTSVATSIKFKDNLGSDILLSTTPVSQNQLTVDVSGLIPGVYFVDMVLGNLKTVNKKIVIQR